MTDLKDKSEQEILHDLEVMLPQLRELNLSRTVFCYDKNGKRYRRDGEPHPAWFVFANHVEALVKLRKPKKRGRRSKKFTPLACATAYKVLMKKFSKAALQNATGNRLHTKSECVYEIISKLSRLKTDTVEEHTKANLKGAKNFCDILVNDDLSIWGLPDTPIEAAEFILSNVDLDTLRGVGLPPKPK